MAEQAGWKKKEGVVLGGVVQASARKRKALQSKTGAHSQFLIFMKSFPSFFLSNPVEVQRLMLVFKVESQQ